MNESTKETKKKTNPQNSSLALSDMFNEFQIQQDQDFLYKVPFPPFSIPREPEEQ